MDSNPTYFLQRLNRISFIQGPAGLSRSGEGKVPFALPRSEKYAVGQFASAISHLGESELNLRGHLLSIKAPKRSCFTIEYLRADAAVFFGPCGFEQYGRGSGTEPEGGTDAFRFGQLKPQTESAGRFERSR